MAAPHVAGVAALMLGKLGNLQVNAVAPANRPQCISELLKSTAMQKTVFPRDNKFASWDNGYTAEFRRVGEVNAQSAATAAVPNSCTQ